MNPANTKPMNVEPPPSISPSTTADPIRRFLADINAHTPATISVMSLANSQTVGDAREASATTIERTVAIPNHFQKPFQSMDALHRRLPTEAVSFERLETISRLPAP